jgi:hypothetical protein
VVYEPTDILTDGQTNAKQYTPTSLKGVIINIQAKPQVHNYACCPFCKVLKLIKYILQVKKEPCQHSHPSPNVFVHWKNVYVVEQNNLILIII